MKFQEVFQSLLAVVWLTERVFIGKPDPGELDRLWNDYANPLGVAVKAK